MRDVERTSTRLATLTQPISSTKIAPPHSIVSVERRSPIRLVWKSTTSLPKRAFFRISRHCGKRSKLAALMASSWLCACSQRGAGLQAAELLPVVAVPRLVRFLARGERGGPEQLDLGIEEDEIRRQHADDLVGLAAEPQVLADRVVAAAKQPLPEAVREDDDLFLSELALLVGEQLAAKRLRAQHAEERRRDDHRLDALGLGEPGAAQRDAGLAKQRRLLERRHVALAIEVVGHAVGALGDRRRRRDTC